MANDPNKLSYAPDQLAAARRLLGIQEGDEGAIVIHIWNLHEQIKEVTTTELRRRRELEEEIKGLKAQIADLKVEIGHLENQLNS